MFDGKSFLEDPKYFYLCLTSYSSYKQGQAWTSEPFYDNYWYMCVYPCGYGNSTAVLCQYSSIDIVPLASHQDAISL